ncbi:hypothetical protein SAMN02745146_0606 [Hymenobacter daecheongensis DSM 21074]|uniref:Uncharacterized protein n=1 Tax=Hymenobacter daecheongensis DSM 21074 TaxID=1121955 RepID=A0A1M6AE46_9BACT|nr:hypothetical protein [Hymenobacter daecheongensis]SHI34735.1 hypothetical protein SAMN02745146_0606 [Hymenobacter daecheongensis DSM 21074]
MTLSRRVFALLTALLLLATATHAQTPLGQPTLDEQKTQIWCATMKFVYGDTGRPNLQSTLRCGGSLKEFENSIKADSQKVYSMLYRPLEVKGSMYTGLGSDKSRLQKLATEIINKLKASPARRKDAARMQGVQALEAQLKGYVENGTPPTDIAAAPADQTTDVIDTTATDDAVAGPAETGLGSQSVNTTTARPAGGESLMSKFFAPLALILSLLSLFLYMMLRRSISELGSRADRHRNELESVKASSTSSTPARPAATAKGLTPELQRDIEKLVQQRVAEELGKRQGSGQPQGQNPGKPQNQPRNQGNQQSNNQSRPGQPVAVPSPQPQPQRQAAPAPPTPASAPAAAPVAAPESFQEAMPQPPVLPAGSTASGPRDEFDSLIPPVQLPSTNWAEATAPVASTPVPPAPTRYYVKVPVNGGFSDYDLQEQPQHDSIYEITPDARVPERATFRVTSNSAVHAYAIQSAQYSLRDACAYQQPNGPVSRIVTDKDGTLVKSNGAWQIEHKAAIHFE